MEITGPDLLVTVEIFEKSGKNTLPKKGTAVVFLQENVQDDGPPPLAVRIVETGLEFPVVVELTGHRDRVNFDVGSRPLVSASIHFNSELELANGDFITSLAGVVSSSTPPARAEVVVQPYFGVTAE